MVHTPPPAARPLRGRREELERIRSLLHRPSLERPAVLVIADAGIGKSRIVKTLLAEQRIEALRKRERMLLDLASVDGVSFDGGALAAVLELPLLSVLRDLQHIYRETGMFEARQHGFRFSHPVLQDVLFDALAPDLRRAMHRQLALHLERRDRPVDSSRLGNHRQYAGERERALPHLLAAARRATEHRSYLSALDLSERAGRRPDSIDDERAHANSELLLALTSCYRHLARHDEAGRILDAVERSAEHHREWRLALRARVRRAQLRSSLQGQSTLDLDLLRRAARLLPACTEREIAVTLLVKRGGSLSPFADRPRRSCASGPGGPQTRRPSFAKRWTNDAT